MENEKDKKELKEEELELVSGGVSPTHPANIQADGCKTIEGTMVKQAADGEWYWAQEFGY